MAGKSVAIVLSIAIAIVAGMFYTAPSRTFEQIVTASRMGDMTAFANLVNMERIRSKMKMDMRSRLKPQAEGAGTANDLGKSLVNMLGSALSAGVSQMINAEDLALEISRSKDFSLTWQNGSTTLVSMTFADSKKPPLHIILERQGLFQWVAVALEPR
ncbi:MAG: DUF2939 domain-containing protein [Magnetococcales bacterium]|nr:DUF2939 domain-containing protein [Magnetococcales bacterium]